MFKLLVLAGTLLLGGVVAQKTEIPNMNNEISILAKSDPKVVTTEVELYNSEVISIDTANGYSKLVEIEDTNDKVEFVVGGKVTYDGESGGLLLNSNPSSDMIIGFKVPIHYNITSVYATFNNQDNNRAVYLSEDVTKNSEMVPNCKVVDLYRNDSTSDNFIEEDQIIPGGKYYYFLHNGGGITLEDLYINVTPYEAEVAKPPVIEGPEKLISKASQPLSKSDIMDKFTATDSVEGDVDVRIKHDTGYFMALESKKFGVYELTLTAADSHGNSSDKVVSIDYYDDYEDFLPLIEGPSAIIKADNILLTLADMQELYSAKDYEGHVIDLKVVNVNYLKSANKVGTYKVKVVATDAEERTKELAVQVRVVSGLKDMWYVDPLEVYTTQYSKLTIEQLINEYSRFKGLDVYNFELEEDNYSDMVDIPGTYTIKVLISTGEGLEHIEFKVHVDEHAVLVKPDTRSVWDHICSFFKWLGSVISSWFN